MGLHKDPQCVVVYEEGLRNGENWSPKMWCANSLHNQAKVKYEKAGVGEYTEVDETAAKFWSWW